MNDKKKIIRDKYGEIVEENSSCGCGSCCGSSSEDISEQIGYSREEVNKGGGANLGLGCGNPTVFSDFREGEVVVDLGSGAGFDFFLAAERVGEKGKVIGVDMTQEMIEKARKNAEAREVKNVEFVLAEMEKLPFSSDSVDAVISNCVINLSPDKDKVFSECYRALKSKGRMYISDIVLLEELTEEQKNDENLLVGCVGGAILKDDYLDKLRKAGFTVEILSENKDVSEQQYQGINLESLTVRAAKN